MRLNLHNPPSEMAKIEAQPPPDPSSVLAKIYTVLRSHPEALTAVEQALNPTTTTTQNGCQPQ